MKIARARSGAVSLIAALMLLSAPAVGHAKTARNYCNDWSAVKAGSFWSVAGEADDFQMNKGYTVHSFAQVSSTNVYAALQIESIMIAASHAGPGEQIYRNNGTWTCVQTRSKGTHTHAVKGTDGKTYSATCSTSRDLRNLSGINTPCKMIVWMGCDTSDYPTGYDSLAKASDRAGVDHNGAFSGKIYMNTWARDYAYGYWKSLGAGNYTSKAQDDGEARVRLLHLNNAGGYDTHTYVGSDIKI